MIYITCPDRTADASMPARALLATLDLGEFFGPLGQLSRACLGCGRLVTANLGVAHLIRRFTTGVSLLDNRFRGGTVAEEDADNAAPSWPHDEHPGTGPPFTLQDVLTTHELLETDAWVPATRRTTAGQLMTAPQHLLIRQATRWHRPTGPKVARAFISLPCPAT